MPRSLEQFKGYTQTWLRCAQEEPDAGFRVWETDEGPPSHSIPPHLVAKAAAMLGEEEFEALHERLLDAYFRKNRDISSDTVLRDLWQDAGLPADGFDRRGDEKLLRQVIQEHQEAIEQGASGVPAVRAADQFGVLTGAQPLEVYRSWLLRLQSEEGKPNEATT